MKNQERDRSSERGGAGVKFLLIALVLVMCANAGYNYIPVAYEGANLKQEMDTAVVKGLAASGRMKPLEVVQASVQKAIRENNVPPDALVEIKQSGAAVQAHIVYSKKVPMLPFGIYNYNYNFNYVATPSGYLIKDGVADK